jgi:ketosteroid isomerase-like protein
MKLKMFDKSVVCVALAIVVSSGFARTTIVSADDRAPADAQVSTAKNDFDAALDAVDAAQLELQNGRPEAYKALWSRSPDVTLAGGFGGTVEKGWPQVSRRLDWAASQFSKATHKHVRVVTYSAGDLGYVVQLESIRYVAPGQHREMTREYRVTMILRREAGAWHIVHRQADSNLTRQNGGATTL